VVGWLAPLAEPALHPPRLGLRYGSRLRAPRNRGIAALLKGQPYSLLVRVIAARGDWHMVVRREFGGGR